MRLELVTPVEVRLDRPVARVVAEGREGAFGLLPDHAGYVAELVPGVLVYEEMDGTERYAGITEGTLVKCGAEVLVAVRNAILGDDLATLQSRVRDEFRREDELERAARAALARLEAEMVRRFLELEMTP
jgi:F-type H+-transporting ATPase subunit epsilon